MVIGLSTGIEVAIRLRDAQGLKRAKPEQLDTIEISPSRLEIHFPKLDADIYLPALLEGFLGSKRWIAAEHGKKALILISARAVGAWERPQHHSVNN